MIDIELRRQLALDLRRLITGRMTNDDFDDAYDDFYVESNDSAVQEIADFAWCLYSSDTLMPYRLRGNHEVDQETRRAAARAILFLNSGREYEWPAMPEFPVLAILLSFSYFLGLPLGVVLVVIGVPVSFTNPPELGWGLTLAGVIIFGVSLWLTLRGHTLCELQIIAYRESGDYEAWPFLRQSDLEEAKNNGAALSSRITNS